LAEWDRQGQVDGERLSVGMTLPLPMMQQPAEHQASTALLCDFAIDRSIDQ
jgi:hypothetical protein